jgi:hypothetical protein
MTNQYWIDNDTFLITFPKTAHGFKLSPTYKNRMYYYPKEEYDMDMVEIPSQKFVIKDVVREEFSYPIKVYLKVIK